ncbi:hypothetical protein PIB30_024760 [Stylosanthes scabra]|uniref:Uncharacterized protein n=1 Tax=Stylosanthes scabra TaxID=79078 RepID=A0ABU6U8T7_9FABA|nr:hypothetical protein [Stylosanthes scabra]
MSSSSSVVHVALLPSAGMGHLTPFLRFAAMLSRHHFHVTLITPQPTMTNTESKLLSKFFTAFPHVNQLNLHLLPSSSTSSNGDPFFLQIDAIRRSSHLLHPLLSSLSPPLSSFVYDMTLTSPLLDREGVFRKLFMEDSPKLLKLHGVFLNTFEELESDTLKALNLGDVVKDLPTVHALGPFVPCYEFEGLGERGEPLKWLDEQPNGSVIYVCFGSRTALESKQIREIGDGLMRSGFRFLWVVKVNKVDKER